jgi:uncharacterized protein involved in exopolysaccharide biosynthesis
VSVVDAEQDDLSNYLGILWRRRNFILGATLLAAVVGAAVGWRAPSRSSTEATLVIEAPDRSRAETALATLAALLRRTDVLAQTLDRVKGADGTLSELQTARAVVGPRSDLVTVSLSMSDSSTAAQALDALVRSALMAYEKLDVESAAVLRKSLRKQLEAADDRLKALEHASAALLQELDLVRVREDTGLAGLEARRQRAAKKDKSPTDMKSSYVTYFELMRHLDELSAARKTYVELKAKDEQLADETSRVTFTQLGAASVSRVPSPSRMRFTLMIFSLAGFILGTVGALAVDFLIGHRPVGTSRLVLPKS